MAHEESFGRMVRERRRALDLTQEELARRVGCAAVTIRKIEYDEIRPSVQIAERLAMALAIPLDDRAEFVRRARAVRPERAQPPTPTPMPRPEEIGAEDLSGRAIRGYTLGERIGAGGFGVVYRGVQPLVEREVAVKIILPQYANHPEFIRRFEAEAQLVARLEHPHIVPLYDYWREPGVAYLVMRLLRGGSVLHMLQSGPLPLEMVARLIEQIGAALHAAHRVGVVHRDLKPANVLLDEDANAYLADFGIAKNLGNPNLEDQTQADVIVGSPAYFSPEQIRSETVKPQADIYSLGIMLYELLTGARPFQGPTPIDLIQQHLTAPLPPLAAHRAGLPAVLDAVIARATAKDPRNRYPDIPNLLADLRQVVAGGPAAVLDSVYRAPADGKLPEPENPYKGLRAFGEADAADFFGRETLVQQLLARLAEGGDLARFLAVVGPSGSGKSSVVGAGLVPALRRGGLPGSENWFVVELIPGAHPLEELEAALLRIAVNPPVGALHVTPLLAQLREDDRGLLRAVRRCLPDDPNVELVLVVDQFEEVFTLVPDEAVRANLLKSLVTAVLDERSRVRIVVTLRADFTDRPLRYVDFGELLQKRSEFVLPLTPDELERAIVGPAERVGLQLESGMAEAIIRDVADQPGALPLLQYALTELFGKREGRTLTKKAYAEIGGVLGALGRRAEEVFGGLDEEGQEMARQLFLRLVTLGEGTEDTRRRVPRSELASLFSLTPNPSPAGRGEHRLPLPEGESRGEGGMPAVIDAFGKHRLLSFDRDPITRGPTVEVAHEALLREWSRLREWLNESRADVRLQRQLAQAATEWQGANRDVSFLLTGARLEQFEGWALTTTVALTADERTFLDAGLAERDRRTLEEQERQRRELEAARALAETERARAESERQRAEEQGRYVARVRTRNRVIAGAGGIALLLAVLAGLFSLQPNQNATLAQQNLSAAQIANTQSAANAATAEAAGLLALDNAATAQAEAQRRATQQALAEANFTRAEAERLAAEANVLLKSDASHELIALLSIRAMKLQYSPQGDAALSGAAGLDYPLQVFTGPESYVTTMAASSDGKYVLSVNNPDPERIAHLWDVETGKEIRQFVHGPNGQGGCCGDVIDRLTFSPDSRYVVTRQFGDSAQTRVWDVQTGQQVFQFTQSGYSCNSNIFSAEGNSLLIGCDDSTVRIWDWRTNTLVRTLTLPLEKQTVWAISQDGQYALSRAWWWETGDTTMRLWRLGETPTQLSEFTYSGNFTNFTSTSIEVSSDCHYVLIGDLDGTTHLMDATTGEVVHTFKAKNAVMSVSFSPDGNTVLVSSQDQAVRLYDRETGQELRRISLTDWGWVVTFSPDGKYVLTGSDKGPVRLWAVQPHPHLPVFTGHTGVVIAAAFSPDGQSLATGSTDGVRLWNTHTGQLLHNFTEAGTIAYGVEFSGDGRYLLSGNIAGVATLWDVATGRAERQFVHPAGMQIYDMAFSPDGRSLLTAGVGATETVWVWDIQTAEVKFKTNGDGNPIFQIAYSPDGQYLLGAVGNMPVARLWDAKTGAPVREFEGHSDWVSGVAFSPDGKYAATASDDNTARLWDVQTGQEIRQFVGHTEVVWSVAFSPDGKTLATASGDGTARLWDVQTGQELRRMAGHTAGVENVIFSPDGKFIATTSDDGTTRLWDVDYHDTIRYLCSRLLRDFTDEERAQYNIPNDGPTCP